MRVHAITVVGPGRLGGALAIALSRSGHQIRSIVYRSRRSGQKLASRIVPSPPVYSIDNIKKITSPIVLIAVQDEEIPAAVSSIESSLEGVAAVFHTSGSLSSAILEPIRKKGIAVASLHPLASISDWTDGPTRFKGAYFCLEGDKKAVQIGKKIASILGGIPFVIEAERKALYHAAALTAAGHVTALFDIAVGFMTRSGVERATARKLLQPLLAGVASNLTHQDTDKALTGTYARGDSGTMKRHLIALTSHADKDECLVYVELALRSIMLAETAGVDKATLKKMRNQLTVAKESFE